MPARETNPNFMNGVPELLILRLLQKEEMYGYEIVQAIRSRTDAVIAIGEGVVYPVLHGLEKDGALKSRRKIVNGLSRIYYSRTPAGSRRMADLSETWKSLQAVIQDVLTGGQHAKAIYRTSRAHAACRCRAPACAALSHRTCRPSCRSEIRRRTRRSHSRRCPNHGAHPSRQCRRSCQRDDRAAPIHILEHSRAMGRLRSCSASPSLSSLVYRFVDSLVGLADFSPGGRYTV